METNIDRLVAQMTLDEKVSMLAGADQWLTVPVARLGIPALKMTDGPAGARGADEPSGPTSACFPCGSALAATWNIDLVERVGQALGDETRSKGAHVLLAPTVNIHRSPLAGRNFECYSEDPYLTGRMAIAYIAGVQSRGVGACIKHFVCNDSEFERRSMSSQVEERPLREIYLRPFEMAIGESKPWAIMSSYNRVNGVHASENAYTLLDILKHEWRFDGAVISDWWGTYSPGVVLGGLDIEMPGPGRWMGRRVAEAVRAGQVSEDVIDDKVRRILRLLHRVGVFAAPELAPERALDVPEQRHLARQAAGEAIVLLKNYRSMLPLDPERCKSIAVIGENAERPAIMGGGSIRVTPHYVVKPLEAIVKRAGPSIRVAYAPGCVMHREVPLLDPTWLAGNATLEYFANGQLSGDPVHVEATKKMDLIWVGDSTPYVRLSEFSARLTGTLSVPQTGTYEWSVSSIGKSRLSIDDQPVIDQWGGGGGDDLLTKRSQLDLSAGRAYRLTVEYAAESGPSWRELRLGCFIKIPDDSIEQAVALARSAEAAIVFAGLTNEWESEGFDRPDMDLPGKQVELIERVVAANPNTIVVLNVGSPVSIPWLERVAAVVQAWYGGQESGNAIADVLFGDVNPSGKLPTTWPTQLRDNPAYLNYPGENGRVLYGEGLYVGYRYYDKKEIEPLFPFGFGLSYTTFAYRNPSISQANGRIHVNVDVKNTGSRAGSEVVQVYVRALQSRLTRPDKELKGLNKVSLAPGETKTVTVALDDRALAFYDPGLKRWVAEPGEFEILVGSSSRDIRLVERFEMKSGE